MMSNELENPISLPKKDSKRLIALDAARGLAVIGMFIQHFALNQVNSFVSGNTMILFMLCSGISYSIMVQRMTEREVEPAVFRARILARAVFIDLAGYILIMLNGPFAVVLPAYAMLFILALVLIHCSTRALFTISCILYLAGPPLMLLGLSLFSGAYLLSDIAGGPLSALGWAPVFVAGMAIGRLNLHNIRTALRFVATGFIISIPFKLIASFVLPETQLGKIFHDTVVSMDVFLELRAYKGPVLILQGLEDETVNYSYAIRAKESYEKGQCRLQLIRNAGHNLSEKQKESVIASIRQFLLERQELLTIRVIITNRETISEGDYQKLKIYFTGYCDTKFFHGTILPGGCDTQDYYQGERTGVKAEYTLQGIDMEGEKCKVHIVNQKVNEEWKPMIETDSKSLAWLNNADMTAVLEDSKEGPVVRIFGQGLSCL